MAETDDEISLLSRINNGDESAYDELFHSQKRNLYKIAFNALQDASEAEDAVASAFVQLVRKHSQIRCHQALNSWMRTTVRNIAINMRKKRKKLIVMDKNDIIKEADKQGAQHIDFAENAHILDCLEKLPQAQRTALMLKYAEDETLETVSNAMGITVARLRKFLEKGEINFKKHYAP